MSLYYLMTAGYEWSTVCAIKGWTNEQLRAEILLLCGRL